MELSDFFEQHPKAALAFSGGADSAFLLYSAAACGADIMPYFVRSQFQPAFERADAPRTGIPSCSTARTPAMTAATGRVCARSSRRMSSRRSGSAV